MVESLLKTHNLDTSVWGIRIIEAQERGEFTIEDKELSNNWTTCACGQFDARLCRVDRSPIDGELYGLGMAFNNFVDNDDFMEAARCLISIERRAKYLLNEFDYPKIP